MKQNDYDMSAKKLFNNTPGGKGVRDPKPKKEGKKWIQGMDLKKGAFTKQADAAGKSVKGFANEVLAHPAKYSDTTKKRANLAKTFSKMSKKK